MQKSLINTIQLNDEDQNTIKLKSIIIVLVHYTLFIHLMKL